MKLKEFIKKELAFLESEAMTNLVLSADIGCCHEKYKLLEKRKAYLRRLLKEK